VNSCGIGKIVTVYIHGKLEWYNNESQSFFSKVIGGTQIQRHGDTQASLFS
jgi:hypothetical protein